MHGIPAYNTGGLRANFAGSDIIVETNDRRKKLWIQVKTGAPILKDYVYLTQCAGDGDLEGDKFASDFVVFVNLETRVALKHEHEGALDFGALSYYVVPVEDANRIYREELLVWAHKPKRDGGKRKLGNMGVHAPAKRMAAYKDAWSRIKQQSKAEG